MTGLKKNPSYSERVDELRMYLIKFHPRVNY